jgi:hypothetical protein
MEKKNVERYAAIIAESIIRRIEAEDMNDITDNPSAFTLALSYASTIVYNRLSDNMVDVLEFNHLSNRLIFLFEKSREADNEKSKEA